MKWFEQHRRQLCSQACNKGDNVRFVVWAAMACKTKGSRVAVGRHSQEESMYGGQSLDATSISGKVSG